MYDAALRSRIGRYAVPVSIVGLLSAEMRFRIGRYAVPVLIGGLLSAETCIRIGVRQRFAVM